MNALTRRIALVPTALMLLAAVTGCKTGSKRFLGQQTHCTSSCTKSSCGDTCLSSPSPCGSRCQCKVCRCDDRAACGTIGGCRPQCADTKCAIQPNVKSNTGGASVELSEPSDKAPIEKKGDSRKPDKKPMKKAPKKKKPMKAAPMKKKPMKPAPMKTKKAAPMKKQPMMPPETPKAPPMPKPMPMPMPMPKENKTDEPFPVPAAPAEAEQNSAENVVNPFLRVSQTEEAKASASVSLTLNRTEKATPESREADLPSRDEYSQPWADALGLPQNQTDQVQRYRRQ